jgi:hypothetical protein
MGKRKRRPCPRGLYDGCPIPRELCSSDHARTGNWHCLDLLKDFEQFLSTDDDEVEAEGVPSGEVPTLEDLMAALERMDGPALN